VDSEWQFSKGDALSSRIDPATLVLKTEEGARVLDPRFPDDLAPGRVLWLHGRAHLLVVDQSMPLSPRRSLSASRHRAAKRRVPYAGRAHAHDDDSASSASAAASGRVYASLNRSLTRSEARAAIGELRLEMARVERQHATLQTKFAGVSTSKLLGNLEFVSQVEPPVGDALTGAAAPGEGAPLSSPRYVQLDPVRPLSPRASDLQSQSASSVSTARGKSGRSKRLARVDSDYLEKMLHESDDDVEAGDAAAAAAAADAAAAPTYITTAAGVVIKTSTPSSAKEEKKSSPLVRLRRFLSPRTAAKQSPAEPEPKRASTLRAQSGGHETAPATSDDLASPRRRSRSRNRHPRAAVGSSDFDAFKTPRGVADDMISPRDELVTPRSPRRSSRSPRKLRGDGTSRSKSRSRSRSRSKSRDRAAGRDGMIEKRSSSRSGKRNSTSFAGTVAAGAAAAGTLSASSRRRADAINMPIDAMPVESLRIALLTRDGPTLSYDAMPLATYGDLCVALITFARRERVPMPDGCEVCVVRDDDNQRMGSLLDMDADKTPFLCNRELKKFGIPFHYVFAPAHSLPLSQLPSPLVQTKRTMTSEEPPSLRAYDSIALPDAPNPSNRDDDVVPQPLTLSHKTLAMLQEDDSMQPLPSAAEIAEAKRMTAKRMSWSPSVSQRALSTRKADASSLASTAVAPAPLLVDERPPPPLPATEPDEEERAPPPLPKSEPPLGALELPPRIASEVPMSARGAPPPVGSEPPTTARGAPPPVSSEPPITARGAPPSISSEPPVTARGPAPLVTSEPPTTARAAPETPKRPAPAEPALPTELLVPEPVKKVRSKSKPRPASTKIHAAPSAFLKLASDSEQEKQRMRQESMGTVLMAFQKNVEALPPIPQVMELLAEHNNDPAVVIEHIKKNQQQKQLAKPVEQSWDVVGEAPSSSTATESYADFAARVGGAGVDDAPVQGRVKRLSLIFTRAAAAAAGGATSSRR
jgi:hypothetical protein